MLRDNQRLLSDVLKREGNNFDLLRLFSALAVIVGHAYAIAPQPPLQDTVLQYLKFDYSGSLAVKFFFFLSGLLVVESIIRRPQPFQFLARRALRIFPGLILCLILTVFIVGPVFTKLPIREYLVESETWSYLVRNSLLFDLQWRLPGVFVEHKYGLNGSLWTLPYEALCYIFLSIFCGFGLFRFRFLANAVFVSIVAIAFIAPQYLPRFSSNPESFLLPACFSIGALFSINKNLIVIDFQRVSLLWVLVFLVKDQGAYVLLFYIAFFYTAVFFASLNFVVCRLRMPFDASYGVYVYGFVIQQCVYSIFPNVGVHWNQLLSFAIAFFIGVMSWYFIEKPAMNFGWKILCNRLASIVVFKLRAVFRLFFDKCAMLKNWLSNIVSRPMLAEFFILLVLSVIVHAIVLKFVFPRYYSPLWPHHSDFYLPSAIRFSAEKIQSYAAWPRPVGMVFFSIIGYLGIKGSIAALLGLTLANCVLTASLFRRLLKIEFGWGFLVSFIVYLYLLFSQPHFYGFYSQDAFAQLSYFFLIISVWFFYVLHERSLPVAIFILFFLSLIAFLAKETYGLTALGVAGALFFYSRKDSLFRAALPAFVVSCALALSFLYNLLVRSLFYGIGSASIGSPYKVELNVSSVFFEFLRYAREGLNIFNVAMLLLISFACYKCFRWGDRRVLFLVFGCIISAILAWIPNSFLPNHHYSGYSWSGAYLLFLPVFLIPSLWKNAGWVRVVSVAAIVLSVLSPVLSKSQYSKYEWLLSQENTQRNLLNALGGLIGHAGTLDSPERILVTGLVFPFSPFVHPTSLRSFKNASLANYDVVSYASDRLEEGADLVRFIRPADVDLEKYSKVWMFASDGHLVRALSVGDRAPESAPALGIESRDLIMFPDIADILELDRVPAENNKPAILDDGYRLIKCGEAFSRYKQAELALRCFVESIKRIPDNPHPYFLAGLELERLGRTNEAKYFFEQAIAHETESSSPDFRKALLRATGATESRIQPE